MFHTHARCKVTRRGRPWVQFQVYSLNIMDMSVFNAEGNEWYTYRSIQEFLEDWELDWDN